MAKEWILNSAMNRFKLNQKRSVGATSEEIRKCQPKNKGDWRKYYYSNVRSRKHISELGRTLYYKITEVCRLEIDNISEKDCIDYMHNMVIDRTYEGYDTEIKTIYEQLEHLLNIRIEAAPDEWDRKYNVDFYIDVNKKYIGLQIKPVSSGVSSITTIYSQTAQQLKTHEKFLKKYGGKVFYIYSYTKNSSKVIANPEVVNQIKKEIKRLKKC